MISTLNMEHLQSPKCMDVVKNSYNSQCPPGVLQLDSILTLTRISPGAAGWKLRSTDFPDLNHKSQK